MEHVLQERCCSHLLWGDLPLPPGTSKRLPRSHAHGPVTTMTETIHERESSSSPKELPRRNIETPLQLWLLEHFLKNCRGTCCRCQAHDAVGLATFRHFTPELPWKNSPSLLSDEESSLPRMATQMHLEWSMIGSEEASLLIRVWMLIHFVQFDSVIARRHQTHMVGSLHWRVLLKLISQRYVVREAKALDVKCQLGVQRSLQQTDRNAHKLRHLTLAIQVKPPSIELPSVYDCR